MFVLTFVSIVLILPRGKARRIVDGLNADGSNWDPFLYVSKDLEESPNYDITRWVRQLHLQQCAFVEIGEGFCAFCEEIGPWTSVPAEINSLWSRWSSPKCNNTCGRGFVLAIATCQDQVTGKPAIDCIGPGSFCCPDSFAKCYCEVNIADGVMRAARFTEPCISTEGCIPSSAGTFTFEGELDPGGNIDFDEVYENDDRERFEDTIPWPESARPARHLLQAYSRDAEYGSRENRPANKKLRDAGGYRSALRRRLDDDDDYQDDDDDAEEGDGEEDAPGYDDKVDEEEDEEEDGGEETVTDEEQGRYYDYDAGGSVSIGGRAPLVAELVALIVWLQLL